MAANDAVFCNIDISDDNSAFSFAYSLVSPGLQESIRNERSACRFGLTKFRVYEIMTIYLNVRHPFQMSGPRNLRTENCKYDILQQINFDRRSEIREKKPNEKK